MSAKVEIATNELPSLTTKPLAVTPCAAKNGLLTSRAPSDEKVVVHCSELALVKVSAVEERLDEGEGI